MSSNVQKVTAFDFAACTPSVDFVSSDRYRQIYEANRHRVYAVAFWMMDSELAAEQLMIGAFERAFQTDDCPTEETVDEALMTELHGYLLLGRLTLNCSPTHRTIAVRRNIRRVDLERALVQLPATEKLIFVLHDVEGYQHRRIARLLAMTESESQVGLHQARLRLRELLAD